MSEEKLYAVKNDKGQYWDFDSIGFWSLDTSDHPITPSKEQAEQVADNKGGHVVTLIGEPKPLVVPEWFDKWLDAFCRQGDGYSWRGLAVGRILQQGWGKSINDSYKSFEAHWTIPHVENKQVDYVLHHKKELMVAALTGNYTVAKEKKYLVYKVLGGKQKHEYFAQAYRSLIYLGTVSWFLTNEVANKSNEPFYQFTEAEIEQYGLQDCEKEEVTDDEV